MDTSGFNVMQASWVMTRGKLGGGVTCIYRRLLDIIHPACSCRPVESASITSQFQLSIQR
jgi:hypothetical protein